MLKWLRQSVCSDSIEGSQANMAAKLGIFQKILVFLRVCRLGDVPYGACGRLYERFDSVNEFITCGNAYTGRGISETLAVGEVPLPLRSLDVKSFKTPLANIRSIMHVWKMNGRHPFICLIYGGLQAFSNGCRGNNPTS